MRRKDIELVKAVLDEVRVTPEQADAIIGAMKERYAQEIQTELDRQRTSRLKSRETWADSEEGMRLRNMAVGEWFIIPKEKVRVFRAIKNSLNKLEIYGRWSTRAVTGIGDIVSRLA